MNIARIHFLTSVNIPGRTAQASIDPAAPAWEGWTFIAEGDHLTITSPVGFMTADGRELSPQWAEELAAVGCPPERASMVIREPLSRVRLVLIGDPAGGVTIVGEGFGAPGGPLRVVGPSSALRAKRAAKSEEVAKSNAATVVKQAVEAPKADRMAKARQVKAEKAAKKAEPKRPPWASKDPPPPPSPPEEDAP